MMSSVIIAPPSKSTLVCFIHTQTIILIEINLVLDDILTKHRITKVLQFSFSLISSFLSP